MYLQTIITMSKWNGKDSDYSSHSQVLKKVTLDLPWLFFSLQWKAILKSSVEEGHRSRLRRPLQASCHLSYSEPRLRNSPTNCTGKSVWPLSTICWRYFIQAGILPDWRTDYSWLCFAKYFNFTFFSVLNSIYIILKNKNNVLIMCHFQKQAG